MRRLILFLGLLFCFHTVGLSQCAVNTFIEDNYTEYAKFLALREIQSDPADPDYDNPIIPTARITPFLEKLSAIYENPNSDPDIDRIFGDFSMNVNPEYMFNTPYNLVILGVDSSAPWLDDFINTGVSGDATLDNLVSTYGFYVSDITIISYTIVYLLTDLDAFNIPALQDEFLAIEFVDLVEPSVLFTDRFNYDGISYNVNGFPTELSDITVEDNRYTFCLYSGDCPVGCLFSECWTVEVSEDCSTVILLNTPETNIDQLAVYPNPATDIIHIHGVTSEIKSTLIYSVAGQLMHSAPLNSEKINISNLQPGIYFIEIITSEGNKQTQKFIKHY